MNTSPISLPSVAPTHESPAVAKQSDSNSDGESFSQALTREISERREASQADPSRPAGSANSKAAGKTTKNEESQPAGEKDKDEKKDEASDAAGSVGMLALMLDAHQLSGKGTPSTDKADIPAGKTIDPDAGATKKSLSTKPDEAVSAAAEEKIAGAHDSKKTTSDALDTRARSKTKDFAEDLREAGKDARQAAKTDGNAIGTQAVAEARMEALRKDASGHDKALELHPTPAGIASLMSAQQAASLHSPGAAGASALSPQVGTPAWDRALGQKIVWMVGGEQQSASLTLNPPDLGPLQVVLNVSNSMADATFITAQPEVRHALEQAMPKLREMMSDAGIQLGQANVSTGTPNGNHAPRDHFPAQSHAPAMGREVSAETPARVIRSQPIVAGQGLVDTFV